MIIVIGGIKGGTGKTTIATNLTVMRTASGKKVLLVDADDQGNALDWVQQRNELNVKCDWSSIKLTGKFLHKEVAKFSSQGYEDIIIDSGGRDTTSQRSALCIADKIIIPFRPNFLDMCTMDHINDQIDEAKQNNENLKVYALIMQADSKGNDNIEAYKSLQENERFICIPQFIGDRKAFRSAASLGKSVVEINPKDKKAIAEITSLYETIYI